MKEKLFQVRCNSWRGFESPLTRNTTLTDTRHTTDLFGSQNHSYDFEMKRPIFSVAAQNIVARGRPGVSDQEVSVSLQQSLCSLQTPQWHLVLSSNTFLPNITEQRTSLLNQISSWIMLMENIWNLHYNSEVFDVHTVTAVWNYFNSSKELVFRAENKRLQPMLTTAALKTPSRALNEWKKEVMLSTSRLSDPWYHAWLLGSSVLSFSSSSSSFLRDSISFRPPNTSS